MKKNIAVIIIDMQDFFLRNFPVSISNKLLDNQKEIINICVIKKLPFILLEYKAGGIIRGETTLKLRKLLKNSKVIIKANNSGFTHTNLDEILRDVHIGTVLLMGLNANGCIQDTSIGALHRGYKVITSKGIIASSSRKDLTLSKRNEQWFKNNTIFFEDTDGLVGYLKSV
ncbi:MAG: cysteine hydrolase [Candidatus Taylorbacteria bacterium]|nr:cysteine hydrolase [Candidatus Taylorbacteria bacterium]